MTIFIVVELAKVRIYPVVFHRTKYHFLVLPPGYHQMTCWCLIYLDIGVLCVTIRFAIWPVTHGFSEGILIKSPSPKTFSLRT